MRPSRFPTAEEIVTSRARREPNRTALNWHARTVLLGRLADLVALCADTIGAVTPPGSHVAVLMSNTPGVIGATLGLWRAGCTAVPLDPTLPIAELARRLRHSRVDAVVTHEEHVDRATEVVRESGVGAQILVSRGLRLVPGGKPAGRARRSRRVPLRAASNEVAFHAYSRAADGSFHAAVLTHANVVASALRASGGRGDGPDDVALVSHPLHDVSAFVSDVLSRLISGGSVAILARPDVDGLISLIEEHRVTDVSLSAEMQGRLVEHRRPSRRAVRSVRKLLSREFRLPLTAKRSLVDCFPGCELIQSYSMPETTDGILMARHGTVFRKPDTLGAPHPGLMVSIVDDGGRPLRAGQSGEIVCRGAVVMRGYYRAEKLTRQVLRDDWLYTGDLGYIDGDGEIELVERRRAHGEPGRRSEMNP